MNVLIITGDGVNCEHETARAFKAVGAHSSIIHINELENKNADFLKSFHCIALPGGFSFGDELGSGKVFSLKLKSYLGDRLKDFVRQGKPIIGICNGFQVLTKLGLLSDVGSIGLAPNQGGHFINEWQALKVQESNCIWLKGIQEMFLPIRHGEGRFIQNKEGANAALCYVDNPNGSDLDIAGVSDHSGLVLGLMPHPEAAIKASLYPGGKIRGTSGLEIFKNAFKYCQENF